MQEGDAYLSSDISLHRSVTRDPSGVLRLRVKQAEMFRLLSAPRLRFLARLTGFSAAQSYDNI